MGALPKYLFGVVTGGLLCAMIRSLFPEKKGFSGLLHLVCSLFLTITVLSPLVGFKFDPALLLDQSILADKTYYIEQGENLADDSMRAIISESCRTYIVEKAASMGVDVDVEIVLDSGENPVPYSVIIDGPVSPYLKSRLQSVLSDDLGIPKERQSWI